MTAVEKAIAEFHARQAAHDDEAIYLAANQAFRNNAAAANLGKLNDAVRLAEGCDTPTRDKSNFSSRVSTAGSFVTVSYTRTCTRGPIIEQFLMRLVGHDGPQLEGYNLSGEAKLAPQT